MVAIHTRDYYRLSPQEALRALNTKKTGLPAKAAAEAESARFQTPQPLRPVAQYAKQYLHPPIALLALGSLGAYALEHNAVAAILLALVFLNATIHWLQTMTLAPPTSLLDVLPAKATVVRGNDTLRIPMAELVAGDIVYLEKGMQAPADIRLIEEDKLCINDVLLTGDNSSKRKGIQAIQGHCPVTLRHNTVLAGSKITTGNAIGVAYAVGDDTELAKSLLQQKQTLHHQASPLDRTVGRLGRWATVGTLGLGTAAIATALFTDMSYDSAFLYVLALLVALIPISLPTVLHLILTHARSLLRRHKAIATSPAVIDRLSTINAVISDTDGVLAKQSWKPLFLYAGEQTLKSTKTGFIDQDGKAAPKATEQHAVLVCTAIALTSQSRTSGQQSLANASATLATQAGIQLQHIDKLYREIRYFAFDPSRQRTSSLRYYGDKKSQQPHVFTAGSPKHVLDRCTKIWDKGKVRKLTADDVARIQKQYRQWAKQTHYVTGAAYRAMPSTTKGSHLTNDTAEAELVWLGLAAFTNPLREHLANAVAAMHSAHIKISLVSDAPLDVAKAVALEAGVAHSVKDLTVMSGESLSRLSNTHVMHVLQKGNALFVHLSSQDKHRLVSLAKQGGKTVAVTGRGLLDTAALAKADVGIGLAATTTPPPAGLVLLDDNFATVTYSIKESRAISRNITTVLRACMTRSATLAVTLTLSLVAYVLFDIPLVLSALHIAVFTLALELFPLATLGRDKPEQDLMRQASHDHYRALFSRGALLDTIWTAFLVATLAYVNYILFFGRYDIPAGNVPAGTLLHAKAMTLALVIIAVCLLINTVHIRSTNGIFSKHQLHNRSFWAAVAFALLALIVLVYNTWVGDFFGTAPLAIVDWGCILAAAGIFAALRELQRLNKKHSRKAVLELHRTHRLKPTRT